MIYLQSLINGVGIGSLYALVGLAALFVLKVSKILNFAVGAMVVSAGLIASSLSVLGPFLLLIVIIALGAPAGVGMHLLSTRWLRGEHDHSGILATTALALAIQGAGYLFYSSDVRYAPSLVPAHSFQLTNGLTIDTGTLLTIAATTVGYVICWVVLEWSNLGRTLRATSDDRIAALLIGISARRIELLAYAILGSLTFAVGVISAQVVGATPDNVFPVLTGALFGLVLGGSGSLWGPLVGGMLIGVVQSVANATTSQFWASAAELGLVLVVLAFARSGLFPDRWTRSVA